MKRTLYTMGRPSDPGRPSRKLERALSEVRAPSPSADLESRLLAQVPMNGPAMGRRWTPIFALTGGALAMLACAAVFWPKGGHVTPPTPGPTALVQREPKAVLPTPDRALPVAPPASRSWSPHATARKPHREPRPAINDPEVVAMRVTVTHGTSATPSFGRVVALSSDADGRPVKTECTLQKGGAGQFQEDTVCVTDASGVQHKISSTRISRDAAKEGELR